jgi:hypothetical protein
MVCTLLVAALDPALLGDSRRAPPSNNECEDGVLKVGEAAQTLSVAGGYCCWLRCSADVDVTSLAETATGSLYEQYHGERPLAIVGALAEMCSGCVAPLSGA